MEVKLPTCTVVVCTRDRLDELEKCLAAVTASAGGAADVLVVDSAPAHGGAELVAARWGARYVREPLPGASRARNRGARESDSEVIAYVDGDAVPEPGWLEPLLAEFADPGVTLVAGRVLPPEADMDMLSVYGWLGIVDHGRDRLIFDRSVPGWYVQANFDCFLLGANMAFRRAVFEGWGGFDERLGAGTRIYGAEEPKAFFELVERGHRAVYAPGSVVRHAFPRSEDELRRRALRAIEASSAYLALLYFEVPAHRDETWGYIKAKLKRVAPMFKRDTGSGALVPGYRVTAARLKGVLLYLSMRLSGGGR